MKVTVITVVIEVLRTKGLEDLEISIQMKTIQPTALLKACLNTDKVLET